MAPPMTVGSEQNTTTRRPFTRPTAASIPESSSGVITSSVPSSSRALIRWTGYRGSSVRGGLVTVAVMSVAPEGHGDVGTAEAEGVVQRRDVTGGEVASRRRDVQIDQRVEVVQVDRGRRHPVMDRQHSCDALERTGTTE